jgi:pimeloyl-ACP methyl ester carboxylesterase
MARITEKTRRLNLHGEEIAYRTAGEGPALLLIHGITSDSTVWERVMPGLARQCTVIAPDLAGHGESHRGRGDYSLGAHASTLRDLLMTLGHTRATVLGHSLGGGVAMQFAYQFPEMCERLVLVDSGGLGQEVSFLLRAATLPGSELVLPLLAASRRAQRSAGCSTRWDCTSARTSSRWRTGTERSQMANPALRSFTHCARSSTTAVNASMRATACTSPSTSRS